MTTHPKREYTLKQIEEMKHALRSFANLAEGYYTRECLRRSSDMLELLASKLADRDTEQHRLHRMNIERDGDDYIICDGSHERGDSCNYIRYVDVSQLSELNQIIEDGKRQWNKVAALLGADGDNVDDVIAKASQLAAQKREGDEAWKPIETAPKDRHILLYGEVDGGNRSCDKTLVSAIWVSGGEPGDIFGEEGGWMVSFTDDCIAAVVDPTHWREKPLPPSTDQDREVSL